MIPCNPQIIQPIRQPWAATTQHIVLYFVLYLILGTHIPFQQDFRAHWRPGSEAIGKFEKTVDPFPEVLLALTSRYLGEFENSPFKRGGNVRE